MQADKVINASFVNWNMIEYMSVIFGKFMHSLHCPYPPLPSSCYYYSNYSLFFSFAFHKSSCRAMKRVPGRSENSIVCPMYSNPILCKSFALASEAVTMIDLAPIDLAYSTRTWFIIWAMPRLLKLGCTINLPKSVVGSGRHFPARFLMWSDFSQIWHQRI